MQKKINYIEKTSLKSCDILLSCGTSFYSHLVVFMDGGDYSHASIFTNEGIVQCDKSLGGVVKTKFKDFLKGQKYVDAYRFKKSEEENLSLQPVLNRALFYLNNHNKYDTDPELFLLGMLLATRKLPENKFDQDILLPIIKIIVEFLEKTFTHKPKGTNLICSELVYRCFLEAIPTPRYKICTKQTWHLENQANHLKSELQKRFQSHFFLASKTKINDIDSIEPQFVSPKDLEYSPSLEFIGRISDT